jgi:glutathione S-transferase
LDYNVVVYKRLPTRSAPPELKKVFPLGRVRVSILLRNCLHLQAPVLEIDGKTLAESGAIISYLLQHYGKPEQKEYNQDDIYWAHYAEGSLMILLQMGAVIGVTSKGFSAQAGLNEEEQKGVAKYSGFIQVRDLRLTLSGMLTLTI